MGWVATLGAHNTVPVEILKGQRMVDEGVGVSGLWFKVYYGGTINYYRVWEGALFGIRVELDREA